MSHLSSSDRAALAERAQVTALLSRAEGHLEDLEWAREQLCQGTYGTWEFGEVRLPVVAKSGECRSGHG